MIETEPEAFVIERRDDGDRARFRGVQKRFSETIGDPHRYGMAEALQKVGLRLEGTYHRGIDDARNMVRLLPWVLGRRGIDSASTS